MRTTIFAAFVACSSLAAQTSTVRLAPAADTYADEVLSNMNFGKATTLKLTKQTNQNWIRTFFQFDVSSLKSLGAPGSAVLRIYQLSATGAGCLSASAHEVSSAWTEAGLTWQNQPNFVSTPVDYGCVGDSFYKGWRVFDVTSIARKWWTGANHGIMLRTGSEIRAGASRPALVSSREGSFRPVLELRWTVRSFGAGCGRSEKITGRPVLFVEGTEPRIGQTYELRLNSRARSTLSVLFFGLSDQMWGPLRLPLNLGFFSTPNCNLYVSGEELIGGRTDRFGQATWKIPLPPDSRLRLIQLHHQVFVPTASRPGGDLSQALQIRIVR